MKQGHEEAVRTRRGVFAWSGQRGVEDLEERRLRRGDGLLRNRKVVVTLGLPRLVDDGVEDYTPAAAQLICQPKRN